MLTLNIPLTELPDVFVMLTTPFVSTRKATAPLPFCEGKVTAAEYSAE